MAPIVAQIALGMSLRISFLLLLLLQNSCKVQSQISDLLYGYVSAFLGTLYSKPNSRQRVVAVVVDNLYLVMWKRDVRMRRF
jgi:hypothetical protein